MPSPRTAALIVRAPAKVNLRLNVVAKRADGYHELDSLMFPISLYDTLRIRVVASPRATVRCVVTGPERVEGGSDNLAARAALGVLGCLGETAQVSIGLHKVIPSGAGLGGGSSDAAAVIRCLPRLLGRRLRPEEAFVLARSLGADVPFFLDCRPARATGIGDLLTAIDAVPRGALLVAVPPDRVNTAWAYRSALPRLTSARTASRFRAFPRHIDAVESWFSNDFQPGVEAAVGSVKRAREALESGGARATVLSGSGSAVVGLFESASAARLAAKRYDGPGQVHLAKILRRPPAAQSES